MRYLLLFCLLVAADAVATPTEEYVEVGLRKQLFVDDYVVAKRSGVVRKLGEVTKANGGQPVFRDGRFYGTVLHDGGRFKMWYRHYESKNYGYAESTDGIHFEKWGLIKGINFASDVNMSVTIDPHESDRKHRYKASYDAPGMAAGLAYSADGFNWTPYNNGKAVTYRAADTYNQIFWDGDANTYRLFTRTDYGKGGGPLAKTAAKDFEVRGVRSMVNPDVKADPTNWTLVRQWYFDREGPKEYLRRQIYALTDWIYHGVHFGLMSLYEYPSDVSEGKTTDPFRRHERDIMSFYIGTSRDADTWDLSWVYSGTPFVPRGGDGCFDKDLVLPASSIVTHDDRHWIYYEGATERHGTFELEVPVEFKREHAIGLAWLRLDGFVALVADDLPATVETRPFKLEGSTLEVNVDAIGGEFWVEVLDGDGQAIDGLSTGSAHKYRSVDELRLRPRWKGRRSLDSLQGKEIRLRFHLRNAKLYAFQIAS